MVIEEMIREFLELAKIELEKGRKEIAVFYQEKALALMAA